MKSHFSSAAAFGPHRTSAEVLTVVMDLPQALQKDSPLSGLI